MKIEITDEDLRLIKRALECRIQDLQKYKNLKTIQSVIKRLEDLEYRITLLERALEQINEDLKYKDDY